MASESELTAAEALLQLAGIKTELEMEEDETMSCLLTPPTPQSDTLQSGSKKKMCDACTQTEEDYFPDMKVVGFLAERLYEHIDNLQHEIEACRPRTPAYPKIEEYEELDPDVTSDIVKIQQGIKRRESGWNSFNAPFQARRTSHIAKSRKRASIDELDEWKSGNPGPSRCIKTSTPKLRGNDMVPIGEGYAKVSARVLRDINWNSYTGATRKLLTAVFTRSVLATHSLTGKASPAFPGKPAKRRLDPRLVDDIVQIVVERTGALPSHVRTSITTKCADESKMYRSRQQQNRENIDPN